MNATHMYKKGFTLIELLVVISIIGLLSSVVFASLNSARARARDSKRIAEMKQVQIAMQLYYDKNGFFPADNGNSDTKIRFTGMISSLVAEGFLSTTPTDPSGNGGYGYHYANYGAGPPAGALIVARLEAPSQAQPYPGSCRPWPYQGSDNWCSTSAPNQNYCLCNPY